ncbi:MAG: M35 family metallo-endopeptidase [Acidobacteriota bacterium]
MKRNVVLLLAVAVVLAIVAGSAIAAPRGERGVALNATLNAARDYFEPTEPIALEFRIENRGPASVFVLRWQLPSDEIEADLLAVTRDGQPVAYLGPLVKRAEPTLEDYVEIKAGDTLAIAFDPSAVYDLAEEGQYSIQYRAVLSDVLVAPPEETPGEPDEGLRVRATGRVAAETARVESNTMGFWFKGVGRIREPEMGLETIGGYTKCTTTQQVTLQTAHSNATSISNKAIGHLAANPNGSSLYTYWFGTYTSQRFTLVKGHYNTIWDAFANKSVTYDCGCKKRYYAYVYPSQPYKIYLCKVFWTAPALGRDSQAGTLVHEMSHFYVTASTDDYVYGATGAHNLALTNPDQAVDNADNHEYFAEDQP